MNSADRCAQCGTYDSHSVDSEYGLLCTRCAFRQNEYDERRAVFTHLTPSTFGFLSEEE